MASGLKYQPRSSKACLTQGYHLKGEGGGGVKRGSERVRKWIRNKVRESGLETGLENGLWRVLCGI